MVSPDETRSIPDSLERRSDGLGEAPGNSDKISGADQAPEEEITTKQLKTTLSYRAFVLVSASFVLFEILFLSLYLDTYWFPVNIRWLGIPCVLLIVPVAHFFLRFVESKAGSRIASPLKKGLPLVIYTNWLKTSDSALAIGRRQIAFDHIDELWLTIFGNLHIRTRALRGNDDLVAFRFDETSDLIFKLPFGITSPENQRFVIGLIKSKRPAVKLNQRLEKKLKAAVLPHAAKVPLVGSIIMFAVLLDLGQANFGYLEILKGYYLADRSARDGKLAEALQHFERAESIQENALKFSWVNNKLFREGKGASGVLQARAEALVHMKRPEEALQSLKLALEQSPKTFRINLKMARLLHDLGREQEALAQVTEAIDSRKESFLARLYMLAMYESANKDDVAVRLLKVYEGELKDEVFGDEPVWPPGGNRFAHDYWYREDIDFVFGKLVKKRR